MRAIAGEERSWRRERECWERAKLGSPAGGVEREKSSSCDGTNTDAGWKYAAWCNVFVVWVGLGGGFGVVKVEEGVDDGRNTTTCGGLF